MFIQKELECSDSARDGTKFNSSDTFGNMRALDPFENRGISLGYSPVLLIILILV